MKTQYEDTPMPREHRTEIDHLATDLLNIADEDRTREQAANIVREHGFGAHVGGHHIAIHHKDSTGAIRGARLAIITHEGWDWK